MLDIWTAKVDRCGITQAITKKINKTTLMGFGHALYRDTMWQAFLRWTKVGKKLSLVQTNVNPGSSIRNYTL